MDFDLTEEQQRLKREVRSFLEQQIAPVAQERDLQGPLTRQELVGFIKKLIPLGYYNGMLPVEYGGRGLDSTTTAILLEELSRVWSGLAASLWIASSAAGFALLTPEMTDKYLPRVIEGDLVGCAGITEPDAGSNSAALRTTAVLEGDRWIVNGTKTWISNGSIADLCNVLAVTDSGKGVLGISTILVERATSPWEHRELHKIGWRAFPTAELFFSDCRVPKSHAVSGIGRQRETANGRSGYQNMMTAFESARATMATLAVGICQAAVDAAVAYARQRKQFGRPIAGFQMVQEMIADMIAETEASRLLTYRCWHLIDKGRRARMESSLVKAYACEAAVRVASRAVQIHGALGLAESNPVERYLRDARTLTIPDGTTQIQKLVVGREVLGIKAFE